MSSKDEEAAMGSQAPPPPYGSNEGPPSYNETQPSSDMAPPPSYDSLYGKVKAAKQTSEGNVDFCKKFFIILIGSVGCTIMLGIIMAIPITMIVIGAIHKDNCPAERMIPIYLIVAGSFGILKNLSSTVQRCKNSRDEDADEKNAKTNPFDATLNCFLFAWFIAGNVWIYGTNGDFSTNPDAANYCNGTLYWFAFWVTTATYIFMGTICCCVCVGGILAACCGAMTQE